MSTVDWKLIKKAKDRHRETVVLQHFADKLQTLERLREREAQLKRLRAVKRSALGARSVVQLAGQSRSNELSSGADRLFLLGADSTFVAIITMAQVTGVSQSKTLTELSEPESP